MSTRVETIRNAGGEELDGHLWLPGAGSGPGLLLFQEIFGVGEYIRDVAVRLAELGYVVMAPDLFWRIERNVALNHDEASLGRAFELAGQFDMAAALEDCDAALAHLRSLPEVDGGAGVIGFCLGGTIAWLVAARSQPDAAVSYYGSGVPDALDRADEVTCPTLLHFGGGDPYIPSDQLDRVRTALTGRPNVQLHVQEGAGHAFDNHKAPMFHDPAAAEAAWTITRAFLGQALPVRDPGVRGDV